MLSYYQFLVFMERLGRVMGYNVKVRSEGFDMVWENGQSYSFNFGVEGNASQSAIGAVNEGHHHIQLVLDDVTADEIGALKNIVPEVVDLRVEFSQKELFDIVMPKDGLMIRRARLKERLRQMTGLRSVDYRLDKAVEAGLIEKVKESHKVVYYRRC